MISSDSYEDADFEDYVVVAVLLESISIFLLFSFVSSSGSVVNLINY